MIPDPNRAGPYIPDHSEARCERVLFMANERCRLSAGHQGDHEAGPYREAQDADSKRRFSSDSTGDRVPPAGEGADRGGGGASSPSASEPKQQRTGGAA